MYMEGPTPASAGWNDGFLQKHTPTQKPLACHLFSLGVSFSHTFLCAKDILWTNHYHRNLYIIHG